MKISAIIFTASMLIVGAVQADIIASFNFDGDSAASSDTSIYSSATTPWDLSNSAPATSITNGASRVTANHNDGSTTNGTPAPGNIPGISATTVDASNGGAQWQQFSFTVDNLAVGETLSLTSFDYSYDRFTALNFQSGVYSSLSGYTGIGDVLGVTSNFSGNGSNVVTPSIDLTANPAFSGLTNGQVVEFRIYLKDSSQNVNSRTHILDDIVLNGSVVAVPEPSSLALLLVGAALIAVRRRPSRQ